VNYLSDGITRGYVSEETWPCSGCDRKHTRIRFHVDAGRLHVAGRVDHLDCVSAEVRRSRVSARIGLDRGLDRLEFLLE
jgi:hypothetical protein